MAIYCIIEIENYLPTGKCKIGYSERPFKRMSELQTGNSHVLKMYAICRGTMQHETELHNALMNYRINNEWFNFEQCEHKIIEYFNNIKHKVYFYDYAFYDLKQKLQW